MKNGLKACSLDNTPVSASTGTAAKTVNNTYSINTEEIGYGHFQVEESFQDITRNFCSISVIDT